MMLTKQGGILKPFAMILGYIMEGIFWVLDKIGVEKGITGITIILFTVVIYVLMLPLTYKQQKFSKLSQKMNPELNAIRNKYQGKNDQESMTKMNMETNAVYAKYGVSPSGSCVQLLIQMPILFALYRVIYNMPAYVSQIKDVFNGFIGELVAKTGSSDFIQTLSGASYYSKQFGNEKFDLSNTFIDVLNRSSSSDWVSLMNQYPDLREKIQIGYDTLEKYNTFIGINIANSPSFTVKEQLAGAHNWAIIIGVCLIPLLSALTQWINTKLMPQPANDDPNNQMASTMKTMNVFIPIMSVFFCYTLPAGMGLYWIVGSVIRSVIQICVNKKLDTIDIDEMIKQNIEKVNEKRAKQGLAPQKINENATINTKQVNANNNSKPSMAERAASVKDSTDYYKNANAGKEGSLASKAMMVKQFNEKNNK